MDEKETYQRLANKIHHFSFLKVNGALQNPEVMREVLRDLDDGRLLMRCELQGLMAILVQKGIATQEEIAGQIMKEMEWLLRTLEKKYGFKATNAGLER